MICIHYLISIFFPMLQLRKLQIKQLWLSSNNKKRHLLTHTLKKQGKKLQECYFGRTLQCLKCLNCTSKMVTNRFLVYTSTTAFILDNISYQKVSILKYLVLSAWCQHIYVLAVSHGSYPASTCTPSCLFKYVYLYLTYCWIMIIQEAVGHKLHCKSW